MCKSQGDKKLWYLEDSENSCTADQEIGWGQVVKDFIHYSRELGLYPEGNQGLIRMSSGNEACYKPRPFKNKNITKENWEEKSRK